MAHVLHHHNPLSTLFPSSTDTSTRTYRPRTPPRWRTSYSYSHPGRANTLGIHSADVSYCSVCHGSKRCMVYCWGDSQYRVLSEEYTSSQNLGCVVGRAEYGSRCCSIYSSIMGYLAYQGPLLPLYTPPKSMCSWHCVARGIIVNPDDVYPISRIVFIRLLPRHTTRNELVELDHIFMYRYFTGCVVGDVYCVENEGEERR